MLPTRGTKLVHFLMAQRQNPRSLVNVLRSIRKTFSGSDLTLVDFANHLSGVEYEYKTKALSFQQLSKIENNGSHIAFWQIEMYAKYIGTPSAFILLLSRISSEFKKIKRQFPDGPRSREEEMLRRFADVSKLTKQFRDVCDYIDAQVWDIYNHTHTDEEAPQFEQKTPSGINPRILFELYQVFCEGRTLSPAEIQSLLPINSSRNIIASLAEEPVARRPQLELFPPSEILSKNAS